MNAPIYATRDIADAAERVTTPAGAGELVWHIWGSGSPLVLLHGDYGSWSHWIRNIPALQDRFRLLVPDIPGYGDSALPENDDLVGEAVTYLAEGLDFLLPSATAYDLAGFSRGGIHATHLAARHGTRTRRLVLIGAGGMGIADPIAYPRPLRRLSRDMDEQTRAAIHENNLASVMFHDPAKVDALAIELQDENTRRTRVRATGIPESDILLRALPTTQAQLFGIWGEHDVFSVGGVPLRAEILRAHKVDIDFRIVDGAGHWVIYEAADTVNAMLLEMLG